MSPRKVHAPGLQRGAHTAGFFDKEGGLGILCRLLQTGHIQLTADADVFTDGFFEQNVVLEDDTELGAKLLQVIGAHIFAFHPDTARLDVIKPHQQTGKGAFSCAGRADNAQTFAPIEGKIDSLQIIFLIVIRKVYVFKDNMSLLMSFRDILRGQLILGGHNGFNALGRSQRLAPHGQNTGDGHHGVEDDGEIGQKRRDGTRAAQATVDTPGTHQNHQHQSQIEGQVHGGLAGRHHHVGLVFIGHDLPVNLFESHLFTFATA